MTTQKSSEMDPAAHTHAHGALPSPVSRVTTYTSHRVAAMRFVRAGIVLYAFLVPAMYAGLLMHERTDGARDAARQRASVPPLE